MKQVVQKNVYERLEVFGLAITEIYGVGMWCFDHGLKLIYSTAKEAETLGRFFEISGCRDYLAGIIDTLNRPLLLQDIAGMTWVVERVFFEGEPTVVIMMGPVFKSIFSEQEILSHVASMSISAELKSRIKEILGTVPVVTLAALVSYTQLMHYMMTETRIRPADFLHKDMLKAAGTASGGIEAPESEKEAFSAETVIKYEKRLLDAIREGNSNGLEQVEIFSFSNQYMTHSGSELRDGKNTMLIFCALSTRAAIEGGMIPKAAKRLEAFYLDQIEQGTDYSSLRDIERQMVKRFSDGVRESRTAENISLAVRQCCDYIRQNLTKPLNSGVIAEKMGYAEYYFSKKFRSEMGIKLNDYIKQERIEFAKQELLYSEMGIDELCDLLHFGNRSYFNKVFKELTGMTPAAYRNGGRMNVEDAGN